MTFEQKVTYKYTKEIFFNSELNGYIFLLKINRLPCIINYDKIQLEKVEKNLGNF